MSNSVAPAVSVASVIPATPANNLIIATKNLDFEKIRKLSVQDDFSKNINFQDHEGMTALMYAAKRGDLFLVQLYMENDADINIQDREGMTALMYAVDKMNKAVIEELLKYKPNLSLKNREGNSAKDFINFIENDNFRRLVQELF